MPGESHFVIEQLSRHRYALRNDGSGTAYTVSIETADLSVHEGSTSIDEFPPGHVEEYLLIQPMDERVTAIDITWRERAPDGAEELHSAHLPIDPSPGDVEVDAGGL